MKNRTEREKGPGARACVIKGGERNEAAAGGEEDADVENPEQSSGEKAGDKIAAAAAKEDPGDVALLE